MTDLATMLRQQMQNNLNASLDTAVQAGDITAARTATKGILDLALAEARSTVAVKTAPTKDQIKAALAAKAPWVGVDPRKTAKLMELAKMMDPDRFETADAYADAALKALDDEAKAAEKDGEGGEDEDGDDDGAAARRDARRERANRSPAPELSHTGKTTSNLRRAMESGDIKALPRAAQDDIRRSADKFARTATKEQRETYISNAVKARARSEAIAAGQYDAKANNGRGGWNK